jgi:outer membrane receptor protein involved in Fe transport
MHHGMLTVAQMEDRMRKHVWLMALAAAGMVSPRAGLAQRQVQVAFGDPQPHFVAAWAPTNERAAERSASLALRVSLDLRDVPLQAALKALTSQAGLRITYSPAVLPQGKRVTMSAKDVAVVTALTELLFRSGLDVVVDRDGAMALVRCRHVAPEREVQDSGAIVGRVTDKATGAPIAGATVTVEGAGRPATTDGDGRYRIGDQMPGAHTVRARYIGYAPATVSLTIEGGRDATADFTLEKSAQHLDQVVVTGTVAPAEVKELPTPITIITADQIQEQNIQRIDQLFRGSVPGMVAFDNSTFDYASAIFVRGSNSLLGDQQTIKTFIDNIEVANSYLVATIDPNSVERIEITRGPQASTIYGSEASGGVMQIFTKKGAESSGPRVSGQASVGAVADEYGAGGATRQSYSGSVSGGTSQVSYNVGGSYLRTGEWISDYYSRTGNLSAGGRLTQGPLTTEFSARYAAKRFTFPDDPNLRATGFALFSRPQNEVDDLKQQTYGVRFGYLVGRYWTHNLTLGYDRSVYGYHNSAPRLTTPADTFLSVSSIEYGKASLAYNTTLDLPIGRTVRTAITMGLDHYDFRGSLVQSFQATRSTGNIDGGPAVSLQDFNNTGYFSQARIRFAERLFLTAGLRAEQNDNFGPDIGTVVSPRVGATYLITGQRLTLKPRVAYGEAIRAPQPLQREAVAYSYLTQLANPRLAPERQRGIDMGVDVYLGDRISFGVTHYRQSARDLIENVLVDQTGPLPIWQYQNAGRIRNRGWELEAELTLPRLRLGATYSPTNSTVEDLVPGYGGSLRVGDRAPYIPRNSAGASATLFPFKRTSASISMTHFGEWVGFDFLSFYRFLGGAEPFRGSIRDYQMTYPPFTKYNASLSHSFNDGLSATLSVDNLANNLARERYNLQSQMGRVVTLGVRFQY